MFSQACKFGNVILTGSGAGGTLLTRRIGTSAVAASERSIDGADMKPALTAVFDFTALLLMQHGAAQVVSLI
jgi:hypothetical protein